jgi:hypothetical protein
LLFDSIKSAPAVRQAREMEKISAASLLILFGAVWREFVSRDRRLNAKNIQRAYIATPLSSSMARSTRDKDSPISRVDVWSAISEDLNPLEDLSPLDEWSFKLKAALEGRVTSLRQWKIICNAHRSAPTTSHNLL